MKLYKIHFMNPSIMNESCSVSFGWKAVPFKMSLPQPFPAYARRPNSTYEYITTNLLSCIKSFKLVFLLIHHFFSHVG